MLDTDTGRRLGHHPAEKSYQGVYLVQTINQYHQQKHQQQQNQFYNGQNRYAFYNNQTGAQSNEMQEYVEVKTYI
jgi:hypothetical protein